jgi:predicted RNase H-like HicB family nuclease
LKIKIIIHEAEEGGYWAEVPAIPGCATEGETFEELLQNLYEAIEGCLSIEPSSFHLSHNQQFIKLIFQIRRYHQRFVNLTFIKFPDISQTERSKIWRRTNCLPHIIS